MIMEVIIDDKFRSLRYFGITDIEIYNDTNEVILYRGSEYLKLKAEYITEIKIIVER